MAFYDNQMIKDLLEDDEYPDAGYWKDEVYSFRKKVSKKTDSNNDFEFKAIVEQCPPLNDDANTIGTFTYYAGTHAKMSATANNYYVQLEINNPTSEDQVLTVIINNLEVTTFKIGSNSDKTVKFDVALTQSTLDLTFMNTDAPAVGGHVRVNKIQLNKMISASSNKPRIFVVSDSTAQTYTQKEYPQVGWGAALYKFLLPEGKAIITEDPVATYGTARIYKNGNAIIFNKSIGGRSSRSFIEEGKLASLAKQIRRDDYVLIQWGDNDATSYRPMRYVEPNDFANWLNQYIDCALDRGARPILVTPPSQCKFDGTQGHVSFGPYREVVLQLAEERHLPCIDLGLMSAHLLTRLGPDAAHVLYMQFAAGEYPAFPEGIHDQTHFNRYGAYQLAKIVANEFVKIQSDYEMTVPEKNQVTELGAEVENNTAVRLNWHKVAGAEYYRVVRQNSTKTSDFTALEEHFLDVDPGRNPKYKVIACALDKELATNSIEVPITKIDSKTNIIAGLNIYEVENDIKNDSIDFSLRFTAQDSIELYRVYTFNQRTREKWLLGKIQASDVYKLHSYQVPSAGTWLVQVVGQDKTGDKQIFSKSQIISA